MSAGSPGSRSKTTASGVSGESALARGTCSSRDARFATQISVLRSLTRQTVIRSPSCWRISAVSTQGGRWEGQRFSKKNSLLHPVGVALQRQRPALQMGQDERRDPAVVFQDLGLRETVGGIEVLFQVRQGRAFSRRPPTTFCSPALLHLAHALLQRRDQIDRTLALFLLDLGGLHRRLSLSSSSSGASGSFPGARPHICPDRSRRSSP